MWLPQVRDGVAVGSVFLFQATPAKAEVMLAAMEPAATKNLAFFNERPTLDRERKFLRRMEVSEQDALFLVSTMDGEVPVGTVGLHEIDLANRNARVGALIFRAQDRGKGYGTAALDGIHRIAFRILGLHKLYVRLLVTNDAARAKYAKRGYREEGILREEYRLDGAFHDMVVMGLLEREWREKNW